MALDWFVWFDLRLPPFYLESIIRVGYLFLPFLELVLVRQLYWYWCFEMDLVIGLLLDFAWQTHDTIMSLRGGVRCKVCSLAIM
ncbi:hypothetical protein AQUCO_09400003v1 [Aquilegia coerulea]|uniref:Uncharacterized protein n=1 Tax=Aquilegia coerulea TaxID=218851 RepID=A0A2G5C4W2_AQUCA|nr:hypothetical protein AQUCO_09400003v1 [Aquilegia coerulea]